MESTIYGHHIVVVIIITFIRQEEGRFLRPPKLNPTLECNISMSLTEKYKRESATDVIFFTTSRSECTIGDGDKFSIASSLFSFDSRETENGASTRLIPPPQREA